MIPTAKPETLEQRTHTSGARDSTIFEQENILSLRRTPQAYQGFFLKNKKKLFWNGERDFFITRDGVAEYFGSEEIGHMLCGGDCEDEECTDLPKRVYVGRMDMYSIKEIAVPKSMLKSQAAQAEAEYLDSLEGLVQGNPQATANGKRSISLLMAVAYQRDGSILERNYLN